MEWITGGAARRYGFTSLKKVPGSRELFIALKAREVLEDPLTSVPTTHTKVCVFDVHGNFYLQQQLPHPTDNGAELDSVNGDPGDDVDDDKYGGTAGRVFGFAHVSNLKFEGLEFL
jgi:hypothetical protein